MPLLLPLEQLGIKVFFQAVTHELPGNVKTNILTNSKTL